MLSGDLKEVVLGLAAERPAEVCRGLGRAGRHLAHRLAAALLRVDRQLEGLASHIDPRAMGDLLRELATLVEPPCSSDIWIVAGWVEMSVSYGDPARLGALLDEATRASAPYARLAVAVRWAILSPDLRATEPELRRALAVIDPPPVWADPHYAQLLDLREGVAESFTHLAWLDPDPASRSSRAHEAIRVCEGGLGGVEVANLHGHRARAQLLIGGLPPLEGLELDVRKRRLLEAVQALMTGPPQEAAERFQTLERQQPAPPLLDVVTGLAVAEAAAGDVEAAEQALERARARTGEGAWLPWLALEPAGRTVELIVAGKWKPSPTEAFPPQLPER